MRSMAAAAVILDFDGVLVESNDIKTEAFGDLFRRYPLYQKEMMRYHLAKQSLPRREKFFYFATVLMGYKAGSKQAETIVAQMAEAFSALVVDRVVSCPPVTGTMDFLEYFKGRLPLFIASNTPCGELAEIVQRRSMAHYFRAVYGNPPVPKTAAIAEILHRHGFSPEAVVFVGDAPSDHQAAQVAGIRFIGRDSGLFGRVDFPLYPDMAGVLGHLKPLCPPAPLIAEESLHG